MANVSAVISSIRNIMRQDRGISGDAQRLEQLGWMLFLKIMDDKDQELEVIKDNYVSVIPEKFQWRNLRMSDCCRKRNRYVKSSQRIKRSRL